MATGVDAKDIAAVRDFNRFYTRQVGALREQLLGTPHSLTEARVLYELGRREQTETADLREALELDPGYLSRILARFERDGAVRRTRSAADGRRQVVELTAAGRRLLATLERRSDTGVRQLLEGLDEAGRARLAGAMEAIRELLEKREPRPERVSLRGLGPGDLGWMVSRHGALYDAEWGWDASFEALVAEIVGGLGRDPDRRRERGWIAELDGRRAGCVYCAAGDAETAKLRLLLVEPWARGHGIGSRLVAECVSFAGAAGYARIALWTTDAQVAARRIYEAAGFERVSEHRVRAFGHDHIDEDWALTLG